jgi:DNA (cytosine-5)-methyltransferase 1
MTKFEEWPDYADVDVLVGGTPCQDYSVAGLRAGMDGIRGSLTLVYAAIARRYRTPWVVWENVPGVLSSNGGRDFGSFLGLLSGRRVEVPAGGWQSAGVVEGYGNAYGLAWRVLDAQFVRVDGMECAVPQRRRRCFVVGYLGDWRRAAAVLFEREGMSGNPAPRRDAGQGIAGALTASSARRGGIPAADDAGSLIATTAVAFDSYNSELTGAVTHTLRFGNGEGTPCVMDSKEEWAVRRLMPIECERLQAFPHGYTDVEFRGKPAADGPRYKALGNSMACNVMRWLGKRIDIVAAIIALLFMMTMMLIAAGSGALPAGVG